MLWLFFLGLINPPRSRSSDNLQKYSPAAMRKGNSESTSSPLTRRLTGDSLMSRESSSGSIAAETNIPLDPSSPCSTLSKTVSPINGSKSGMFLH